MNENIFMLMEVSFSQYYNKSGRKIDVEGYAMSGEFFGFSPINTEDGMQIVGVVRTNQKEIYYVPTPGLALATKKKVFH